MGTITEKNQIALVSLLEELKEKQSKYNYFEKNYGLDTARWQRRSLENDIKLIKKTIHAIKAGWIKY